MSKTVKIIKANKWTNSKDYKTAHEYATKQEDKKYPKQHKKLNKWIEKNTKKDEYVGMNELNGKEEVEKKVPKKYRQEVLYHEKEELTKRKQLRKK